MSLRRHLGATYRLQLRPGWGFDAAARIVPYLSRLGIETLYLSPVAEAVPGSTHGYDGTDPTRLRAELGGDTAFDALVAACELHGLGICVDHVPNHLSTWHRGPWWRRLLAEGRDSEIGDVFDVDWDAARSPSGRPQVVLPLLDRPLEDALTARLVRLGHRDGEAVIEVGGEGDRGGIDLPVAAGTASARSDDDVAEVLAAQHYRLADWHDASCRNYRRFFDIDGLVGVRVEVPSVFARTHALVATLARTGRLSAVRVDHVDGLRDPTGYLRRLAELTGVPVVVEKILTGDEPLRRDWPVAGTTGYEVIDDVGGLLVDADGLEQLVAAGRSEGDQPVGPLTVETRRLVTAASFPAELARAARGLGVATAALGEVAVRLPRYRTYLRPLVEVAGPGTERTEREGAAPTIEEGDELAVWQAAADDAESAAGTESADAETAAGTESADAETAAGAAVADGPAGVRAVVDATADPARRSAVLTLQQLTGAIMAKGMEDTAWYRLAGPLAFCEVGGDPGLDRRRSVERFHARAAARAARGVFGLVPGTTHDTKRSEDVRCRLYALSELPAVFERGLEAARAELGLPANGGDFAFESRVAVQLALAILPPSEAVGVGGGPESARTGETAAATLEERLGAALEKGAREAKLRSSWQKPDAGYESRLRELAAALLSDRGSLLHRSFGPMVAEVARLGAVNSLSAVVLRHASPGTPDTYQGDETWNLSLVDPDNRRPVDHTALSSALDGLPGPGAPGADAGAAAQLESLRRSWMDGRVKLFVTARALTARRGPAGPALAQATGYVPLAADGPAGGSVVAFSCTAAAGSRPHVVAVATRRSGVLPVADGDLPSGRVFADTELALPPGAPARYRDALSGRIVEATRGRLALDVVLATLPVALLVSEPGTTPTH